jgi:hypothetical protein
LPAIITELSNRQSIHTHMRNYVQFSREPEPKIKHFLPAGEEHAFGLDLDVEIVLYEEREIEKQAHYALVLELPERHIGKLVPEGQGDEPAVGTVHRDGVPGSGPGAGTAYGKQIIGIGREGPEVRAPAYAAAAEIRHDAVEPEQVEGEE